MGEQCSNAVTDEVCGGFEPCREQQYRGANAFVVVQDVVAMRHGETAEQVVVRVGAFGRQEVCEVRCELVFRFTRGSQRRGVRAGLERGDQGAYQRSGHGSIGHWPSKKIAYYIPGQREGEIADDIGGTLVLDDIDQITDLRDNAAAQLVDVPRGENVSDQPTQPVVVRRVAEQHGAPESMHSLTLQLFGNLRQAESQRLVGLAEATVTERSCAVVVATQYQDPRSRDKHGLSLAQASERLVGAG